jgi:UDP-N-acetylglucosamine 2-epimerase (non-hydrolysing)
METFGVTAEHNLSVMREGQGLTALTARILTEVDEVLAAVKPSLVLVHGDTASAMASALAAFYRHIPVGHVEAGLRTHDLAAPFPEEFNRLTVGAISTLDFAPTEGARDNLLREGKAAERVFVTGNTVADAVAFTVREEFEHPLLSRTGGRSFVLVTCHRRENLPRLNEIFSALRAVAERFPDTVFLFPLHPNPAVREPAATLLGGVENILLTEPLPVAALHNLLARCEMVVTDSGGLQEEALTLGRPVAVLRDTTERPEGLQTGGAVLLGTEAEGIVTRLTALLRAPAEIKARAALPSPYGEAGACDKIVSRCIFFLTPLKASCYNEKMSRRCCHETHYHLRKPTILCLFQR